MAHLQNAASIKAMTNKPDATLPISQPQPQHDHVSEVAHLDSFYHRKIGHVVAYFLRKQIQPYLKLEAKRQRLGFGYPFMCLPQDCPPVLIPSEMGALCYGAADDVKTASIASDAWPIASEAIEQLLICHGLEYCYDAAACLAEANRVLTSAGELCLIVPNRRSLWVRDDRTPLGHGRPFSKGQITKLLIKSGFEIHEVRRALFVPPKLINMPFRLARAIDRAGQYLWALFGGVIIIRASKRRYAVIPKTKTALIPALSPAIKPALSPAVKPAIKSA